MPFSSPRVWFFTRSLQIGNERCGEQSQLADVPAAFGLLQIGPSSTPRDLQGMQDRRPHQKWQYANFFNLSATPNLWSTAVFSSQAAGHHGEPQHLMERSSSSIWYRKGTLPPSLAMFYPPEDPEEVIAEGLNDTLSSWSLTEDDVDHHRRQGKCPENEDGSGEWTVPVGVHKKLLSTFSCSWKERNVLSKSQHVHFPAQQLVKESLTR